MAPYLMAPSSYSPPWAPGLQLAQGQPHELEVRVDVQGVGLARDYRPAVGGHRPVVWSDGSACDGGLRLKHHPAAGKG
jgi:hypothetical protein